MAASKARCAAVITSLMPDFSPNDWLAHKPDWSALNREKGSPCSIEARSI